MVGCELLPISHPSIESGPPGIDAIEIGRVIDRGIRESKCN
jgi:exosome complex component RRP42